MKRLFATISMILTCCALAGPVCAQEHDHQDWNTVNVGRMVALARVDMKTCGKSSEAALECGYNASAVATEKLKTVEEMFDCHTFELDDKPEISERAALSSHDNGPLVIAERDEMRCRLSPTRQLIPVNPQEFMTLCSQVEWKCDVVWISDGDPSVWYINRFIDLAVK